MATMYGAISSNKVQVKDVAKFTAWFRANMPFGHEVELFEDAAQTQLGVVQFGAIMEYPSCNPRRQVFVGPQEGDYEDRDWNLEQFAKQVRKHLTPTGEMRVLAVGYEKLNFVTAHHLVITHAGVSMRDTAEGFYCG